MENKLLSRYNVTLAGNQDAKETLMFVNGLGTDQRAWHDVMPAFKEHYRLVLFDNVGAVESNQDYFWVNQHRYLNVSGYVTDLLEICSALTLDGNTTMIGHSLGAMAGLLASIQNPRQFKQLVLIAASPRYANTEGYIGGFLKSDIDDTYVAMTKDYSSWSDSFAKAAMGNPDRPHLAEHFAESLRRIPKDMMLTVLCSVLQTDQRECLSKVKVPALVVQSRGDLFVPLGVAEYLCNTIPDCRLRLIEATGHLPHVSAPGQVIEAIREFIQPINAS